MNIRPATENDIPALAQIHVQGWKDAYGGLVYNEFLNVPTIEDRTQQWQEWIKIEESGIQLAIDGDGTPVGLVSYGKLKTPPPGSSPIRPLYSAEIYGLYLLPEYHRQGIGTALMKEAAQKLQVMKHKSLCLWVLEGNKRAVSFYKAKDGQRCGKHDITLGPTTAREVCFGWRDTNVLIEG